MMMSKTNDTEEAGSLPAFTTPTPQLSSVEDLERRLKLIGNASPPTEDLKPAAVTAPVTFTAPVAPAPVSTASTAAMTGKTALLVRLSSPARMLVLVKVYRYQCISMELIATYLTS